MEIQQELNHKICLIGYGYWGKILHKNLTSLGYNNITIVDVVLDNKYTINVANPTISPDPTINDDDIFISLISLKTACIIDQSVLRTKAAMEGIRAALGPAQLSVAGSLAGIKMIIEQGPCAAYEELVYHWDIKEATAIRAVLSPFVGNKFDPRAIQLNPYRSRDLYS
jgi:hypothetical protein